MNLMFSSAFLTAWSAISKSEPFGSGNSGVTMSIMIISRTDGDCCRRRSDNRRLPAAWQEVEHGLKSGSVASTLHGVVAGARALQADFILSFLIDACRLQDCGPAQHPLAGTLIFGGGGGVVIGCFDVGVVPVDWQSTALPPLICLASHFNLADDESGQTASISWPEYILTRPLLQ